MNWLDRVFQIAEKTDHTAFFNKLKNKQEIEKKQYQSFNNHLNNSTNSVNFYIQKVINYYKTTKYQNRWLSRGIEPPEDLKFFLYEYARKYGQLNHNGTYQLGDYSIELIIGQGSYVVIRKNN
jgi:hypothetical protein